VIAGRDRGYVTAMVFPDVNACRELDDAALRAKFGQLLKSFAAKSTGLSTRVAANIFFDTPPSIDAHELTDKGSISQRVVLENRADVVEELYTDSPRVIRAD
jgi:feruloyl-CoA synthase